MNNSHCSFRIPRHLLPEDTEERYNTLYSLFNHVRIDCKQTDDGWKIRLASPCDPKFYVDKGLEEGLLWWAEGTEVRDIPWEYKRLASCTLMLHDTWTLYSWVEAVKSRPQVQGVTILHFDAHRDLMDPQIGLVDGKLCHLTTMEEYDLFQPNEVIKAVKAGTIDQGCYMVPFVHAVRNVHIIHVVPMSNSYPPGLSYKLIPVLRTDKHIWPGVPKLSVELARCSSEDIFRRNSPSVYLTTSSLYQVEDIIAGNNNPVFMHIDMDFFYNKYNRQSDWKEYEYINISIDEVKERIDFTLASIHDLCLNERIIDTSIALVPGFYPAEYWEESVDYLLTLLN
jgi:hypothetical protein